MLRHTRRNYADNRSGDRFDVASGFRGGITEFAPLMMPSNARSASECWNASSAECCRMRFGAAAISRDRCRYQGVARR
jgi:hypothetical protein